MICFICVLLFHIVELYTSYVICFMSVFRIGDNLMLLLLETQSIFIFVRPSCHVQIAGLNSFYSVSKNLLYCIFWCIARFILLWCRVYNECGLYIVRSPIN